ncbi:MAG TPA: DUF1059 domain-containing protein [Candidatus Acidoferrales bacterium]|nr:DUF1059 domain-containing protein [Candidatus Acidoferrales bacterium]
MSQVFHCSEIFHDCRFVASSSSRDEVLAKAAEHAREAHHLEEITPEIAALVRAAIRERWASPLAETGTLPEANPARRAGSA